VEIVELKMTNDKAQMSNQTQSPNDKIKILHLGIWILTFRLDTSRYPQAYPRGAWR